MTDENQIPKTRLRISQEMIAIITVGIVLAGLMLFTTAQIVEEGRASRAAWQAERRQLQDEAPAESKRLRDEARSDREVF